MDWNNDGKKDLILGENNGNVRIYLNTHLDEDPVFQGYTLLMVGGSPFSCGYSSKPHVVDWNNDGKKDVLCGANSGNVYLMINVGTDPAPVFDKATPAQDGGAPLDVGYRACPTVVDWNLDGKKDLLAGHAFGNIQYFENAGTDQDPVFNGSLTLTTRAGILDVDIDASVDVADWDGDGIMDIICGDGFGYVSYFHALGPLSLSANRIFENVGGQIALRLNAGAAEGGRSYLLLGSVSGSSPGTLLPGGLVVLPVNWDFFTNTVLGMLNTSVFQNFLGVLDGEGKAMALFDTLGPVPGTAGIFITYAYALNKPWDYASNPCVIEIVQ